MKILEMEMTHFGKFHGKTIQFHDGLNIIHGRNEAGKSTMHAFIRSMFFGIQPPKGRPAKNTISDYQHYEPWDNPSEFGGRLWFEKDGITYRIERSFAKDYRYVRLVRESDGASLEPAEEMIRELISPLNEATFDNTISIAQMQTAANSCLADELRNYMANLGTAHSAEIHLNKAADALKKKRRRLVSSLHTEISEARGEIASEERQQEELILKTNEANQNASNRYHQLQGLIDEEKATITRKEEQYRNKVSNQEAAIASLKEQINAKIAEGVPKVRFTSFILFLILAIACAAVFLFGPAQVDPYRNYCGAAAAAFLVLAVIGLLSTIGKVKANSDLNSLNNDLKEGEQNLARIKEEGPGITREKLEMYQKELDEADLQLSQGDLAVARCLDTLAELDRRSQKLDEEEEENRKTREEIDAVDLAVTRMDELASKIHGTFGYDLNREASGLLAKVTEGRYTRIAVDEEFNISINTKTRLIPLAQCSRGTIDQIYLCVRLAAASLLTTEEESFPVFMDDVLVFYDDDRLRSTLAMLEGLKNQVILFTCQTRETDYYAEQQS